MASDPYWNSVVLGMRMEDTALSDLKGHKVTSLSAKRSSTQKKFGNYSAYFSGSTGLFLPASDDWNFGTGPVTFEFWVFRTSAGTENGTLFDMYDAVAYDILIHLTTSGTVSWIYNYSGGGQSFSSALTITENAWTHVALTRDEDGVLRIFINGVVDENTATYTGQMGRSTRAPYIGRRMNATNYYIGYIDDLRVTKGVCRYSETFTVPTETIPTTLPQLSGTVLNSSASPAARTVRSYRRSDGTLGGETTSSASDGSFSVDAYDGSPHYVVCLDDDSDENALVLDNIIPVI